jgi:DNA-binding beta-propeller fold protein YncE
MAYDSLNHEVYVMDWTEKPWGSGGGISAYLDIGNSVWVVDGLTVVGNIPVGSCPIDPVYDPLNNLIYVSAQGQAWISVINGSTNKNLFGNFSSAAPTYAYQLGIPVNLSPYGMAFDSKSRLIFVCNYGVPSEEIGVVSTPFNVSFQENGLPASAWAVTVNGVTIYSNSSSILVQAPDYNYSYTVSSVNRDYSALASSGSFIVNGSDVTISITFITIPEFQPLMLLPLFMMISLLTAMVSKKKRKVAHVTKPARE